MLSLSSDRAQDFLELMRFDKPIGTLLLLWPTLSALWLAADGIPAFDVLIIFILGVVFMRAAGCAINDYADRNIDGAIARTHDRPLADGRVSPREALAVFSALSLLSFVLVLLTNSLTVLLSVVAAILVALYPFAKRYTHLPQVVLGAAWAWVVPMAFAAQTGTISRHIWPFYLGVVLWTVAFDTFYAMVDREDDKKIGVKSTAILFAEMDLMLIGLLQGGVIVALLITGQAFSLTGWYFAGVAIIALLFVKQHLIARDRDREGCFAAFRQNNTVGAVLFVAIVLDTSEVATDFLFSIFGHLSFY